MYLRFKTLEAENILAFEKVGKLIDFSDYEGKSLLIMGENHSNDTIRSNGAGKSSILEILYWTLFGETYRVLEYSDEIVNLKSNECSATIKFDIDNINYKVTRSKTKKKSPELRLFQNETEILKDSDTKTKQEHLEKILGYNARSFSTAVMFHQDFLAFSDLKPAPRAEILTEISNLEKWDEAVDKTKKKVKFLEDQINSKKSQIDSLEKTIVTLMSTDYSIKIKEFEKERTEEISSLRQELLTFNEKIEAEKEKYQEETLDLIEKIDILQKDKESLTEELKNLPTEVSPDLTEEAEKLRNKKTTIENEVFFLSKNVQKNNQEIKKLQSMSGQKCPTCNQIIPGESVETVILKLEEEKRHTLTQVEEKNSAMKLLEALRVEINDKIAVENDLLNERKTLDKKVNDLNFMLTRLDAQLTANKTILNRIEQDKETKEKDLIFRIKKIREKENPFVSLLEEQTAKTNQVEKQKDVFNQELSSLQENIPYIQFWITGFKKVKMMLFDELVQRLQELSQEFLSEYCPELTITITSEKQTKSGNVRDEIYISIEKPEGKVSYSAYSGGEKQQIKLSVSLALAQVVNELCDRSCNIIFFDEPNDSLDSVGKNINFQFFSNLSSNGKGVVIVDHDGIFNDQFDNIITVVKTKEQGSTIEI